jgi:hypothetical protein
MIMISIAKRAQLGYFGSSFIQYLKGLPSSMYCSSVHLGSYLLHIQAVDVTAAHLNVGVDSFIDTAQGCRFRATLRWLRWLISSPKLLKSSVCSVEPPSFCAPAVIAIMFVVRMEANGGVVGRRVVVSRFVEVLEGFLFPCTHSSFLTSPLYYAVPDTSNFLHILYNISAHAHCLKVDTLRQKLCRLSLCV